MTSRYQHLNVVERIEATFGPFANIWDRRHEVWRFDQTKISQLAPVVVRTEAGRELWLARWGLLPHWFQNGEDEARRFQARTFNARSETAHEKASFKQSLGKRRCLVPATGFVEWQQTDAGKQEVLLHATDGAPLALAGLWSRWRPPAEAAGEPWLTFTILTTTPNAEAALVHDRMPVVLAPADRDRWLDPTTPPADVRALLRPAPDGTLTISAR